MAERSVNGVLVGGACLVAEKFASIVKSVEK
jgi:triosephosphate isomerase